MKPKKIIIFYSLSERGGVGKIIVNFKRYLLKKNIKKFYCNSNSPKYFNFLSKVFQNV
jgi:hypothetical protein